MFLETETITNLGTTVFSVSLEPLGRRGDKSTFYSAENWSDQNDSGSNFHAYRSVQKKTRVKFRDNFPRRANYFFPNLTVNYFRAQNVQKTLTCSWLFCSICDDGVGKRWSTGRGMADERLTSGSVLFSKCAQCPDRLWSVRVGRSACFLLKVS
jgi:hypothetical protein